MSNAIKKLVLVSITVIGFSATVQATEVDFTTVVDHMVSMQLQHTSDQLNHESRMQARHTFYRNHYSSMAVTIKDLQASVTTGTIKSSAVVTNTNLK